MGTKAALITGAARRIGRAIATHLAGEGWDIAIHYNTSRGEALSLEAEVKAAGVDCRLYQADLTDPAAADPLVERCVADFPHTSLLVNSASVFKKDTIASLRPELWDEHLRINALAPILLTRAFHRFCRQQHCVINMLDQKVANATPDFFSYTISKLALHNATRMMAMSLWPQDARQRHRAGAGAEERRPDRGAVPGRAQEDAAGRGAVARRDLPGGVDAGQYALDHGAGHHHRRRAAPAREVPVRRPAEGMSRWPGRSSGRAPGSAASSSRTCGSSCSSACTSSRSGRGSPSR